MLDAKAVEIVDESTGEFWMQLLRPILIIGVVLGFVGVLMGLSFLSRFNEMMANARTLGQHGMTSLVYFTYAIEIGLPLSLVIGSIMGLKRLPRARLVLVSYAWIAMGFAAFSVGSTLWNTSRFPQTRGFSTVAYSLQNAAMHATFPAILLILLMKKPIAELFRERANAFEVMSPPPNESP